MTALALCVLAFLLTLWAGKKSLGIGLVGLLTFGYLYGILRANLPTAASHFIFDAALLGLYASQDWMKASENKRSGQLTGWVLVLTLWPALLIMMPFQPLLVTLVGFRGAIFFLPMILLGSRLREKDLFQMAAGLAGLNLMALAFAGAEYVLGVPRFYPMNDVTMLIYISEDVAGGFYRIPATFVTAHAYGAAMVASLPYLIGVWDQAKHRMLRLLLLVGAAAALLGVLLSATRSNFVMAAAIVMVALFNGRMKTSRRAVFVALIVAMMGVALTNQRLQRFKSLSDSQAVENRIAGSVNRGFFEILVEYPMGNGLGGGGTSMPYFLQGQVRNPVAMENEYARILAEQGVIGLLFWVAFIGWFLSRTRKILAKGPWATSRRLVWGMSMMGLITGLIGTGMLTSIPETAVLLLGMGFLCGPRPAEAPQLSLATQRRVLVPHHQTVPSFRSGI